MRQDVVGGWEETDDGLGFVAMSLERSGRDERGIGGGAFGAVAA